MIKSWMLMALTAACAWSAADLDRLVDTTVKDQLSRLKAPGAVVEVVKDGSVVLSRGYGFADIANQVPMTADGSLTRPASISKLFTAIAVVQLANEGRLDLDRDVNNYLDFHIPTPPGGVPVTLRLLLEHRAGFEEHFKDLFTTGRPEPLAAWVKRSLPLRLFPYGDVPAYSNYGYALAGYIVQRASGVRFEDYAATHILKPLGMEKSTFEQPPPAALAQMVSRGYFPFTSTPLPYFETLPAPAGGLSATGADMGRFLLALLKDDGVEGARLAYEEDFAAGNRFVGKHGLTNATVSELALLPEAGFGMFVWYNGGGAYSAPTELLRAIAERYFKKEPRPMQPLATAPADAAAVAGAYQSSRRADSNFLRMRALTQQLVVRPLPDGRIAAEPQPLRETAPLVWEGSHDLKISFRKNARGGMTMSLSAMPLAMEYQRVPWYLDRRLVLPAVGASLGVMAVTLLLAPLAAVLRRRTKPLGATAGGRREHLWTRLVLGIDLLVAIGSMGFSSLDLTGMNAALDPWLIALYGLSWLGVLGSPVVVWIAFRFWRDRVGGKWARIHQTLLAVSVVIFAWFCVTWRMAGTTLKY